VTAACWGKARAPANDVLHVNCEFRIASCPNGLHSAAGGRCEPRCDTPIQFAPSVDFGTQTKWIRLINVEVLCWFLLPSHPQLSTPLFHLIFPVRVRGENWAFYSDLTSTCAHLSTSSGAIHSGPLFGVGTGFMIRNCCSGIRMIMPTRTAILTIVRNMFAERRAMELLSS